MARYPSVEVALGALQERTAELERALEARAAELAEARRVLEVDATLERVRAAAMAIQHSDEMLGVAVAVFDALRALGVPALQVELGGTADPDAREGPAWTAGVDAGGAPRAARSVASFTGHPALDAAFEAGHAGVPDTRELDRPAFEAFLRAAAARYPASYTDRVVTRAPASEAYHVLSVPAGAEGARLTAVLAHPPDAGTERLLARFAGLFGAAYARQEGVRRAEGQARDARVEAALERVRARALAMRRSADLDGVVASVFEAMETLGVPAHRVEVAVVDADTRRAFVWSSSAGSASQVETVLEGHPLAAALYAAWRAQRDLSYILEDADREAYYGMHGAPVPPADADREYVHAVAFPAGLLVAFAAEPFAEDTVQVMQRLGRAFQLAHTRHGDLLQAEAQAREAAQQASLDRVRAEIASMRTTADLDRITPLVGEELTALGVPFVRCGVFIVDEAAAAVGLFVATPDGDPLGQVRLPFGAHPLLDRIVAAWRRQVPLVERWDAAALAGWADTLDAHGLDGPHPDASDALVLHVAPFAQGMLFAGSPAPLSDADQAAVQALADAFEVAYARYDDFQRLDAQKRAAEATLADLRAAQQQLVQSEKLASLGALTAGIAHEIKNPLNFVNNFAALSREIAAELAGELQGEADPDLVQELLADLQANAERIEQHGRRADSIVRGMMQHARGGEGVREPVDLNALVEEHVTLAFHGRRALVPDFRVAIERDYAEDVGDAEVVPQDIGRVLINLVNNAFDAVTARAEAEAAPFAPTVCIATARTEHGVEIRVSDNGGGLEAGVRARVFEPFFTTKPAGQGTGLGLSMSHDIVERGHGGRLELESVPGEGATFVVALPAERAATGSAGTAGAGS